MKFTLETSDVNLISAWEPDAVRVGKEWYRSHLILSSQRILSDWTVTAPDRLQANDLSAAIELDPEIILLGTGNHLALPDIDLMAELADQGIGLEIMDTPAACRTYNVLIHESRNVVAALFIG
ncbi:MAG: MTH938/NDUFAF3 family protein [Gammaproteobacteria bacterium]